MFNTSSQPGEYIVIKPPNIRGRFKIILLYYLKDQPKHGYALMKEIARDFGMHYVPSPGIIYPTLQELENEGYIKKERKGRRILYTITEKGRKLVEEKKDMIEFTFEHVRVYRAFTEEFDMKGICNRLVTLGVYYTKLSPEDKNRLREEIYRMKNVLDEFIRKVKAQ